MEHPVQVTFRGLEPTDALTKSVEDRAHELEKYFNKGREEATRIMLHVHQKGVGVCGVYTFDVAETKVTQVMEAARKAGHPLQCTLEKSDAIIRTCPSSNPKSVLYC
ncbi:MAG: hypothetical protein HC938_17585, partial [Nitrospira sp.]|nr:hypothetical protein [Nitrospira sp.]